MEIKNKENIMKKTSFNKCPVCGATGLELFQAFELEEINRERYDSLIQAHITLYGSVQYPSHDYATPCRKCKGGHDIKVTEFRKRANIPVSFYDSLIEDFDRNIYVKENGDVIDISKTMQVIDKFINNFSEWQKRGMGLYIYSGTKGSGKTLLASCICNSLIKTYPVSTKFVSASNLLNLAKNSDGSGNYGTDAISLLCNCALLVIDDLGQKNCGTNWMEDVLFQIIDERYQKKLPTIYTSNIKRNQLEMDDRIVDRVNGTTFEIVLPEICVRAKEALTRKKDFLKDLGLLGD